MCKCTPDRAPLRGDYCMRVGCRPLGESPTKKERQRMSRAAEAVRRDAIAEHTTPFPMIVYLRDEDELHEFVRQHMP